MADPITMPAASNTLGRAAPRRDWFGQAVHDVGGFLGLNVPEMKKINQIDPNAANVGNYQQWQDKANQQWQQTQGRAAPTIDQSQQAQFRGQQTALADMLMRQARGEGPSLAQMQLNQATDRNLAQALALARTTGQGAGGLRQALNAQAQMSQQAAADSAMLRLQEQQAAQNMLGQVAAGARGQDLGLASQQADLAQRQMGMNDAASQFYFGQGLGLDLEQSRRQLGLAQYNKELEMALERMRLGQEEQANALRRGVVGGVLKLGATAAGGLVGGAPGASFGSQMFGGPAINTQQQGLAQQGSIQDSKAAGG